MPFFTIIFVLFLIFIGFRFKKTNADQDTINEKFWEREHEANATRRKDISNLNYITIPEDLFPFNLNTDVENSLSALKGKKMLNLTGKTNTDIKLEYGMQNLEELSQYDDNFTEFVRLVPLYCDELVANNQRDSAKKALEFAVNNHADSKAVFTRLADMYKEDGETDKAARLIDIAEELNSMSKRVIISALNDHND